MPSVTFRLAPTLHERLVKECERREVAVSDFLRVAVERFIDRIEDGTFDVARGSPRDESPSSVKLREIRARAESIVGFTTSGEPIKHVRRSRLKGK